MLFYSGFLLILFFLHYSTTDVFIVTIKESEPFCMKYKLYGNLDYTFQSDQRQEIRPQKDTETIVINDTHDTVLHIKGILYGSYHYRTNIKQTVPILPETVYLFSGRIRRYGGNEEAFPETIYTKNNYNIHYWLYWDEP